MNEDEARELVLKALCDVAPEVDAASIDPDAPFQEQLDLDSMDLTTDRPRGGSRDPDPRARLSKVSTLSRCVEYALAAVPAQPERAR